MLQDNYSVVETIKKHFKNGAIVAQIKDLKKCSKIHPTVELHFLWDFYKQK